MANKITEMMARMKRGMPGKKPKDTKEQGPIGDAVEILMGAMRQAKEKGMFQNSPIFNSIAVMVNHTEKVREALQVAVAIVNLLDADDKEWTPGKAKEMAQFVHTFKVLAVRARMHQKFPSMVS